jgi:hypothetical protein
MTACGFSRDAGYARDSREANMSSRDDEQHVLDAIEDELQTENPELVGYFSAFGCMTPWIKAVDGRDQTAAHLKITPHPRVASHGKHRRTDRQGFAIAIQFVLLIIATIILAVFAGGATWWVLSTLH